MFLNNTVKCWLCISNRWLLYLKNNSKEPKELLYSAFSHPRDLWPFSFLVQTGVKVICARAAFWVASRQSWHLRPHFAVGKGFPFLWSRALIGAVWGQLTLQVSIIPGHHGLGENSASSNTFSSGLAWGLEFSVVKRGGLGMTCLQKYKTRNCSKGPLRARARQQYQLGRQKETRYQTAKVTTPGQNEKLQNARCFSVGFPRVWVGCECCSKRISIAVGWWEGQQLWDNYSLALVWAQVVTNYVNLDVVHHEHSWPLVLLLTLPNESGASYLLVGHSQWPKQIKLILSSIFKPSDEVSFFIYLHMDHWEGGLGPDKWSSLQEQHNGRVENESPVVSS